MKNSFQPSPCPFLASKGVEIVSGDIARPLPEGLRPPGLPFFSDLLEELGQGFRYFIRTMGGKIVPGPGDDTAGNEVGELRGVC